MPDKQTPVFSQIISEVSEPSRRTLLALLMLIPVRKKQGRWLDQGIVDEMVFDPNLCQMVPNKHQLKHYKYEDGVSLLQRYGLPSGAILSQIINEVSAPAISAFIAGHTPICNTLHYVKTKPGGNDHAQDICSAEQKQNPPAKDTRNR